MKLGIWEDGVSITFVTHECEIDVPGPEAKFCDQKSVVAPNSCLSEQG